MLVRRLVIALLTSLTAGALAVDLAVPDLDPVQPAAQPPQHEPVPLVVDGEGKAVIYSHLSDRAVTTMIRELQDAIEATTGAKLPIVKEEPAEEQPAIIIASSDYQEEEGLHVFTNPNRLYLTGQGEGAAWAIADFLERIVGVRWYWPLAHHGRSIQPTQTLTVAPLQYTDLPAFRMRVGWPPFYRDTPYGNLQLNDLYTRLRGGNSWPNQLRVHQPMGWHKHYLQERPEIFALRTDGTRNPGMYCYGDPQTLQTFLENIALHESLEPEERRKPEYRDRINFIAGPAITVSPPDMGVFCTCEDCTPLLDMDAGRFATASRLMGDFTRRLALEVKERWPDKTILYLPYVNYTFAPENIDFPDNVEVQLCGMPGVAMYKEPALRERYQQNIDRWAALTNRKVQTWDYACWPTDRTRAPFQYPNILKEYYQRNRETLVGTFINGGIPDEWLAQHFTMYCWMKLLWDPDFDVDAAADAFATRMFGDAAEPMRELLRLQTDRWEQTEWPVDVLSPKALYELTYPPEILERMKALIAQAREKADDDELATARIDYYTTTFDAFFAEAESLLSGEGLTNLVAQKVPANPVIDGKLDDRWWEMAEPVTFVRKAGQETVPATYETQLRAVWTLDGVTFGLRMAEPNPAALKMDITDRDDGAMWPQNDNAEVFIDVTGRKEGRYYQWMITPAGTVMDVKDNDISWNTDQARYAVHIGEDYWSWELFVPNSMFGDDFVKPATGAAWAGQFTRHRISDGRVSRDDESRPEYSRLNNKLGGFSRNAADFGLIQFIE